MLDLNLKSTACRIHYSAKHELQRSRIKNLYEAPDTKNGATNRDALDDVMGDRAFICPALRLSRRLSSTGVKNYQYRLTHRASNEVWPPWMGVIHGGDVQVRKRQVHAQVILA